MQQLKTSSTEKADSKDADQQPPDDRPTRSQQSPATQDQKFKAKDDLKYRFDVLANKLIGDDISFHQCGTTDDELTIKQQHIWIVDKPNTKTTIFIVRI